MTPTEKLVEQGVAAIAAMARMRGRLADTEMIVSWMHDARNALREVEAKDAALSRSILAIDDWLTTFAPEECSEGRVKEAHTRIHEAGGTLAYIAEVQEQNRKAGAR